MGLLYCRRRSRRVKQGPGERNIMFDPFFSRFDTIFTVVSLTLIFFVHFGGHSSSPNRLECVYVCIRPERQNITKEERRKTVNEKKKI